MPNQYQIQFNIAAKLVDNVWPEDDFPSAFRAVETEVLAWHGIHRQNGAMTQQQLGEIMRLFTTENIQTWALTCEDEGNLYQMTPQRCIK